MDFAVLPPEVNSGRMYAGVGSGPMLAAAAAWEGLAADLSSAASAYAAIVSEVTGEAWLGPASVSMAAAVAPYVTWMRATAEQASQTAHQARAMAAAYESAFAAHVPPPVIAQNRALLMSLVATNVLGQNTAAIAATEMQYAQMWAQDAAAMYGYAGEAVVASTLTPFTAPPQNTNPAGVGSQAAAVGQTTGTAASAHTSSVLSKLLAAIPVVLQELASGDPLGSSMGSMLGNSGELLNLGGGWTFVVSGVLYVLGPLLAGPLTGVPTSLLGAPAAAVGLAAGGTPGMISAGMPLSAGSNGVLAGLGRAASIGGLSVPRTWTWAAPATAREAITLPEPALLGLSEAEGDGLGPGFGAMLPSSLMAAAAFGAFCCASQLCQIGQDILQIPRVHAATEFLDLRPRFGHSFQCVLRCGSQRPLKCGRHGHDHDRLVVGCGDDLDWSITLGDRFPADAGEQAFQLPKHHRRVNPC
jgi:PPE-repeat protein